MQQELQTLKYLEIPAYGIFAVVVIGKVLDYTLKFRNGKKSRPPCVESKEQVLHYACQSQMVDLTKETNRLIQEQTGILKDVAGSNHRQEECLKELARNVNGGRQI